MAAKELVIWDCDGCLVDSEALLKTAEVEALHAAGFKDVTADDCNRLFSGFAPEAGEANFLKEYGTPLPENYFRDQIANSADLFRARLEQLNAKTVLALHAAGRRQVVASGTMVSSYGAELTKDGWSLSHRRSLPPTWRRSDRMCFQLNSHRTP